MSDSPNSGTNRWPVAPTVIVVLVLGSLAAHVLSDCSVPRTDPAPTLSQWQLRGLGQSVERFRARERHYPPQLRLLSHPGYGKTPMMLEVPKDGWGRDFVYRCPGTHDPQGFDLSSMGPDGLAGTADDLVYPLPSSLR